MQLVLGGASHGDEPPLPRCPQVSATLLQQDPGRRSSRPRAGRHRRDHGDARPLLDPEDDSIRIHSCHGRGRQVEVLRDAVLHLLEDDPDPRAPRHHRHVSRHRELRAPDPGDLRRDTTSRRSRTHPARHARDPPGRPLPPPDQPRDGRAGRGARACDGAGQRDRGARPRRARAGAPTLPIRRRGPVPAGGMGAPEASSGGASTPSTGGPSSSKGSQSQHLAAPASIGSFSASPWPTSDQRLFCGTLPLDDVDSADIELAGRLAEFVDRLQTARRCARGQPHRGRLGGHPRPHLGLLDGDVTRRRLAAGAADHAARRPRRRGHDAPMR